MGITVRRSIGVRVIVTEEFKKELEQELQQAASEAQRRIEQMDVQSRNVLAGFQRMDINQTMQARRQIEAERHRYDTLKQDVQRQIEEVGKLEIGSEYPRGTIEGVVEINEGDDLIKKLSSSEIVIKDN
ncbi:MAG: hypothetical protein JXA57_13150, partial [Armatimonadetes bacterium]|nr:hypothetical protein [Armatimonadota bacterium]